MDNINEELLKKELINNQQYDYFEAIRTNKIVSLYYELRIILYLGIMLFTGGLGYFAYQNMGKIGHVLSMLLIAVAIVGCFKFINKWSKPYKNHLVEVNHAYFDYILILAALLIISLISYVIVYFDLAQLLIRPSTLVSACILFFMAYQYDNKALLSMAIVALTATLGISISPVNWVQGEWFPSISLYITSIVLGVVLVVGGHLSETYGIKKHFRFSYQNFGLILYFIGCIAAMVDSQNRVWYSVLLLVSALVIGYYTWEKKEFLFFIYAALCGYIAFSYLLVRLVDLIPEGIVSLVYYFPISCALFVSFLVIKKKHFTDD